MVAERGEEEAGRKGRDGYGAMKGERKVEGSKKDTKKGTERSKTMKRGEEREKRREEKRGEEKLLQGIRNRCKKKRVKRKFFFFSRNKKLQCVVCVKEQVKEIGTSWLLEWK